MRQLLIAIVALLVSTPAVAQVTILGGYVREWSVAPGSHVKGSVRLLNVGDQPATVRFSLADYQAFADGTSSYGDPGSTASSNAGWIELSRSSVTLDSREEVEVPFAIAVPENVPATGSRWSMLLVEPAAPPPAGGQSSLTASVRVRHAIQLATHFREGESSFVFVSPRLESGPAGERLLVVDVVNEGTLARRPLLALELYGPDGAIAHRADQQRGLLLPGGSVRQTFELPASAGPGYAALLLADVGGEDVFGIQYPIPR